MMYEINETHDPQLTSWVASANAAGADFPIQNLPFGVFARQGSVAAHAGVAIGDQILDLAACGQLGLLHGLAAQSCAAPTLNGLLALGPAAWSGLRHQISMLLRADAPAYRADPDLATRVLVPMAAAEMRLPLAIGNYTDAYASVFHATHIGSMFRPDSPLLPNYKYVPIAYHGRASSIVVSGTPVRRPCGQTRPDAEQPPLFGASAALDYEAEVGMFIGPGNPLGQPIPIDAAERQIFGLCLLNDWSARDIQRWEYQPLGPFLSKSFATTISPWIVTLEALAPFRAPAFARPAGDPPPLPYLHSPDNQARGGIDLTVEVYLQSAQMRAHGHPPARLSRSALADLYWTFAQLVTHHASNGCNLQPGDLIASGTVSGAAEDARGCLQELTWAGQRPLELPGDEQRRFLHDGDEVIMRGICARPGYRSIGFGECAGVVLPNM